MGYNIRWESDGVFVEMRGKVNSKEIGHVNNRLYADERYDQISFQVLDMIEAEVNLSKSEILEISALDTAASRWNDSLRMAFLTANPQLKALFEKYYIEHMSKTNRKIGAFEDRAHALKWLNV